MNYVGSYIFINLTMRNFSNGSSNNQSNINNNAVNTVGHSNSEAFLAWLAGFFVEPGWSNHSSY
jgi:hypothetical protein